MQLAIDIGNTDVVFGLYDQKQWIHQWRTPSSEELSVERLGYKLASELLELGRYPKDIERTIISSVVPDLLPLLVEMVERITGKNSVLLGPEFYDLLSIKITQVNEIGTDLVANALAAYNQFRDYCIIVDFGTALTFTTIGADGTVLGVAIAPGLKTAIGSLFQKTAQLPEVPLELPDSAIGKTTIHAIQAGTMMGYIGMVRFLLEQIKTELKVPCKVIATGGLSSRLPPLKEDFDIIDPMLTMRGLILVGEEVENKE